jgi:CheY-like chemotaxis protein
MKKILLIDDDSDDRELFQMALTELGTSFELIEANDGKEALEMILNDIFTVPDIIFLDLNMPRINGKQFLPAIKKIPIYQHVPVIIYTTSSDIADMEYCISLGASGFVTKHYSHRALTNELKRICAQMFDQFV